MSQFATCKKCGADFLYTPIWDGNQTTCYPCLRVEWGSTKLDDEVSA